MLSVNIDRSEPLPLHDQVAAEIRRAIAEGEAGPGERLPLAKDMAAVLGVNKNTVLRALHILRDEGLLDFQRGRGITVAGTADSACRRRARAGAHRFLPSPGLPPRRGHRHDREPPVTKPCSEPPSAPSLSAVFSGCVF